MSVAPVGTVDAIEFWKNRREVIPASPEHEKSFRETFELRADLKDDNGWQMAFEHAAKNKLYPDELNAIGEAIVRKDGQPGKLLGSIPGMSRGTATPEQIEEMAKHHAWHIFQDALHDCDVVADRFIGAKSGDRGLLYRKLMALYLLSFFSSLKTERFGVMHSDPFNVHETGMFKLMEKADQQEQPAKEI